jgi:hypothetical protein
MATLLTSQGHGESMAMAWQRHGKGMAGTCHQGHDMAIPLPRYGDARALVVLYCHGIVVVACYYCHVGAMLLT